MFVYVHNEKSKRKEDRLKLLAKPFDVTIENAGLVYSDVIDNIDHQELDKATSI